MLKHLVLDTSVIAGSPPYIEASHHMGFVMLSLAVALVSSCSALYMANANRRAAAAGHRQVSLLCASLVLGLGLWSMHFIGMLAMRLPYEVSYATWLTALSILPSLATAWLALWTFQLETPSLLRMITSGSAVGIGIAVMHYTGIAAMEVAGVVRFEISSFLMSLVSGLLLSVAAFAVQSKLSQKGNAYLAWGWRLLPALLLTMAMASMHYLSMASFRLQVNVASAEPLSQSAHMVPQTLSILLAMVSMFIFLVLGLANAILRYRDLWQAVALRDARLNAMIDAANDGVITINSQGLVQDFNPAAERVFGYQRDEVIGRNVSMLMPSPLAEQHDGYIHKHIDAPQTAIRVNGREVLGKHKNGHLVPLQLSIGKAHTAAGLLFVGYLQDISERKRTDAQLRIAASVFQHVREGVAIVDANHNISDVNPAFLRLMEQTREHCLGRSLEMLYEDADTPPDMSRLWHTVAKEQYWQSEVMFTRQNGTVWVQRLSISPVVNEINRPQHYIAVISDVTERPGLEVLLPYADLHDSVTGLPTQRLMMDRLVTQLISARRNSSSVGLVLLQLVPSGPPSHSGSADTVQTLRVIAQLLQPQLRSTDTLARFDNEQLALLLPNMVDEAAFQVVRQRVLNCLQDPTTWRSKSSLPPLSLLVGFSCSPNDGLSAPELLEHAKTHFKPLSTYQTARSTP